MARINVLSFEIANLIAAGEVVDRPASVLKELLENAIDAKARKIRADIKSGGITLIKVADDGHGMDGTDLPIAIKRHATSKISDKSDLDSIMTLGFRGEALAATAAVSKLTIISKTAEAESGTMLVSEGGKVTEVSEVGCADGTTVLVQDLFYNVPARRNFLKKDKTEALACGSVMAKIALSHPEIAFEFRVDGVVKFTTVGDGKLINALYSVEGADFAKKLLAVEVKDGPVKVFGYVGRSDNVRSNRNYINTFINKRYVKSNTVTAALEQAFSSYIAPGKFPVSALFIDIDSRMVDVNVHPAKLEVKFSDEGVVFSAVYYAVKNALENAAYRQEMRLAEPRAEVKAPLRSFLPIEEKHKSVASRQITIDNATVTPKRSIEILEELKNVNTAPHVTQTFSMQSGAWDKKEERAPQKTEPTEKTVTSPASSISYVSEETLRAKIFSDGKRRYRYVGELFLRYILLEAEDTALLIDKHAAHERINFEAMKKTLKSDSRVASQSMLFPLEVHLGGVGVSVAEEHRDELSSLGFTFTVDGNGKLKLTAFPDNIDSFAAEDVFVSIVDRIAEGTGNAKLSEEQRMEHALYQIACKASIKSGKSSGASHICWLIEEIMSMPDITVCPHGRPVAIELKKSELDREFNRIQ